MNKRHIPQVSKQPQQKVKVPKGFREKYESLKLSKYFVELKNLFNEFTQGLNEIEKKKFLARFYLTAHYIDEGYFWEHIVEILNESRCSPLEKKQAEAIASIMKKKINSKPSYIINMEKGLSSEIQKIHKTFQNIKTEDKMRAEINKVLSKFKNYLKFYFNTANKERSYKAYFISKLINFLIQPIFTCKCLKEGKLRKRDQAVEIASEMLAKNKFFDDSAAIKKYTELLVESRYWEENNKTKLENFLMRNAGFLPQTDLKRS